MSQLGARSDLKPVDVTIAKGTIHNPADARHFMKLKPVARNIKISRNGLLLAKTNSAIRLVEVGSDLYDPALYIPKKDIAANLVLTEKSTHCPLKGDASYFNLYDDGGNLVQENIAWSYVFALELADGLKGLISFFTDGLTIEDAPL